MLRLADPKLIRRWSFGSNSYPGHPYHINATPARGNVRIPSHIVMLSAAGFVDLSSSLLQNASNRVSTSTNVLCRDLANRTAPPISEGFLV